MKNTRVLNYSLCVTGTCSSFSGHPPLKIRRVTFQNPTFYPPSAFMLCGSQNKQPSLLHTNWTVYLNSQTLKTIDTVPIEIYNDVSEVIQPSSHFFRPASSTTSDTTRWRLAPSSEPFLVIWNFCRSHGWQLCELTFYIIHVNFCHSSFKQLQWVIYTSKL